MTTCTRRLLFSAGHRIFGHEGKCKHIHGHNYEVFVTAVMKDQSFIGSLETDNIGRVIDFSVLKNKIGNWIEQNWDHGTILFSQDGDAIKALTSLVDQKLFYLPYNTTAENLAKYLLEEVCPSLLKDTEVVINKIIVNETENCFAEATLR
jgi:6-pyruvoyltetrahydropterin/6-carboxytetrahydropterin synthase